jgi:hypothetical protein
MVARKVVTLTDGQVVAPESLKTQFDVAQGDELFFELLTWNDQVLNALSNPTVAVDFATGSRRGAVTTHLEEEVSSVFHSAEAGGAFPEPYRGWSYIAYNGNRDWKNLPIDDSYLRNLVIDQNYRLEEARAFPLASFPETGQWKGFDEYCWLAAAQISSSRLGMDDIKVPRVEDSPRPGSEPPSQGTNAAAGLGFGFPAREGPVPVMRPRFRHERGPYPDIVGDGNIRLTNPLGVFDRPFIRKGRSGSREDNYPHLRSRRQPGQNKQDAKGRTSVASPGFVLQPPAGAGEPDAALGFSGDPGMGTGREI